MLEIYTKPIRSEPLRSETSTSVFFNIPQVIFMCRQCGATRVKKRLKYKIKLNVKNSSKEGCHKNKY